MQQLHILHFTFRFTTAQIVINGTLRYALYYITFSLTCGLRIVYLRNFKNLICVDLVKCQVKFCLLYDILHKFLTNLASTGGPHEISRRAACGPRAAGWTAPHYDMCILLSARGRKGLCTTALVQQTPPVTMS